METTREKVSYCIGLETGKNLKQQFSDMDVELLNAGFQDALTGSQPKLKQDEIKSILIALRQQIEGQQKEYVAKLAEHNKKAGEAFLAENKTKEGVTVLPSGLQYRVIQAGTGPSPKALDVVTANYQGSFIDGKVFDSTYDDKPQSFPVGRVIPGWSEVLQLMKVGDKWQVFIPSYLAYGEMGFGNAIGPNMTLVFEMELVSIDGK